jgi:acyl carrier protein
MHELRNAIRQHLLSTHLQGESPENLSDDIPLLTSGILDSLATMNLVMFLEKEFGIELDVYDTSAERFDRITDMAATVARKRTALTGSAR